MSPVRVTLRRTIGRLRGYYTTALIAFAFLAACAVLFAFNLDAAEGGRLNVVSVWTISVAPLLPVLAALLGMTTWSEEKMSGRIQMLLSTPVKERDFTVGKFLGTWLTMLFLIAVSHLATLIALAIYAPGLLDSVPFLGFLPGYFALALQGATWCAVAVAVSAACRHPAMAATLTILLLVGLPRGVWWALMAWAPQGRTAFGEMPLDAQACDFSCGLISLATVAAYIFGVFAALFVATKLIAALRFVGRGSLRRRASTLFVLFLAALTFVSAMTLVRRVDITLDLPVGGVSADELSPRTLEILGETRGEITVSVFLSRKDPQFRGVAQFLRVLSRASESQGGARLLVRYVDPNWDFGAAERLVRIGATPKSLVIERGYRVEFLSLAEGFDEHNCIATIHRISLPPQRRTIYWTIGHGESDIFSYESFGLTTIVRELAREGYRNRPLDLASVTQLPQDCALVVVAGAKQDFAREEVSRLEAYLRQGGRLLVFLSSVNSGGVAPLLSRWGIRPGAATYPGARTLSGTDVIVTDFAAHAITQSLIGSQLVFEKPLSFTPSAAVETGGGADRIDFTDLANVGEVCVAAISERGIGAGEDLKLRPTRLVAVGDSTFVMNGSLAARANANRDFLLNCVAYLAGADGDTFSREEQRRLVSGLDRKSRRQLMVVSVAVIPGSVFALMMFSIWMRRRRT